MKPILSAASVIDDLTLYLQQLQKAGWRGMDCSPEVRALIRQWGEDMQPPTVAVPTTATTITAEKDNLARIRSDLGECSRCALCQSRTHIIFGCGNPSAKVVFVGAELEEEDDIQAEPFVGPAGQLLMRIIAAMKLTREEVYLCNIVKCRPPGDRSPLGSEIKTCMPFLRRQLSVIAPVVICSLGRLATQALLDTNRPFSQLRGEFQGLGDIKVMPVFHPSELLRHPEKKRDTWNDIQKVMRHLNIPVR